MNETDPTPTDPRDARFLLAKDGQSLNRKAGGASIFVLGMSGLRVIQQFASVAIVARLLPPDEYGVFALAMPGVLLAMALSSFGLPQAVIQKKTITHAEVSTLFWANVLFALIASLIVVVLAYPAAAYFNDPRVTPVFQVVSISIVFAAISSQYIAIMRRTLRIRVSELAVFGAEMVGIVVVIISALSGLSYWSLVLQQLTVPIITVLLLILQSRWLPSGPRHARFGQAWESLTFGGFVAGYSILNRMTEYAGTAIIGAQLGAAQAGLFYRARLLGAMPQQRIMTPLSGVFVPTLSRLQGQPEEQCRMYVRLIGRANLILLPVAIMFAAAADPIVRILLGQEWMAAAPLLFWMSIFTLRVGGGAGLQFMLIATGNSKALFIVSILRLLVVIGALYAFAAHGVEAMTASYMLAELFLVLPILITAAHFFTPLTWGLLLRTTGLDMAFATLTAAGLIYLVNPMISDLVALVKIIILGGLVTLVYAAKVMATPSLRAEALRVLGRVGARFGKNS